MEQNLREQHRRASKLEEELERLRSQKEQQPEVMPDSEEFFKDPVSTIKQLLQSELKKSVQPLYDFKDRFEAQDETSKLKDKFKKDPLYRDIFPKIEQHVDNILAGTKEINENSVQAAVLIAAGAYHLKLVRGGDEPVDTPTTQENTQQTTTQQQTQQTQQTRQQVNVNTMPAHLRPSNAGNQSSGDDKKKARPLNELEKRLARERGQSDQEYLDWLEEDPTLVATSKIGKTKEGDNLQTSQHGVK